MIFTMDNFQFCCLFCYQNYETLDSSKKRNNKYLTKKKETLKNFLEMLERYKLERDKIKQQHRKKAKSYLKYLKDFVNYGMGACDDCIKILSAFADLFHKMNTIKLFLNWKLLTLKNIMAAAMTVPSRVELFKEAVTLLKLKEIGLPDAESLMELRNIFIERCSTLLRSSYPKLSLHRLNIPNQIHPKNVESNSILTQLSTEQKSQTHLPQEFCNPLGKMNDINGTVSKKVRNIKPSCKPMVKKIVSKKVQRARSTLFKKNNGERKSHAAPATSNNDFEDNLEDEAENDDNGEYLVENENNIRTVSEEVVNSEILNIEKSSVKLEFPPATPSSEPETLNLPIIRQLRTVHKCDPCGKTFSSQVNLINHQGQEGCLFHETVAGMEEGSDDLEDGLPTVSDNGSANSSDDDDSEGESSTTGTSDNDEEEEVEKKIFATAEVQSTKTDNNLIKKKKKKILKAKKVEEKKCRLKIYRFLCTACNDKTFLHLHDLLLHLKRTSCNDKADPTAAPNQTATEGVESTSPGFVTVKLISTIKKERHSDVPLPICCSVKTLKSVEEVATFKVSSELFICSFPKCSRPFYSQEQLDSHSKLHGSFTCASSSCTVVKDYAPDLALHQLKHFQEQPKKFPAGCNSYCPPCKLKFWRRHHFIEHYLMKHMSLSFTHIKVCCGICLKTVGDPFHLMVHYMRNHNLRNPEGEGGNTSLLATVDCSVPNCSAYFLNPVGLFKHFKAAHSNLEKNEIKKAHGLVCKDCGRHFTKRPALLRHRFTQHVDKDNIIPCKIKKCHRTFETQKELEFHLFRSHQKKMIDCPKCEKSFPTTIFNRHLQFHKWKEQQQKDGVVPPADKQQFVCEQCGKSFKKKYNLQMHLLSHTEPGSWEWMCSVCSKHCMTKQKLEEHQRTHSKEKPFVCEVCGVKYAHRHNLRIHVNSKHGDVVQDVPKKYEKNNLTSSKGIKRKRQKVSEHPEPADDSELSK